MIGERMVQRVSSTRRFAEVASHVVLVPRRVVHRLRAQAADAARLFERAEVPV
ncbi:hypothetical protein AB0D34_23155 [Streptomyces sp. NPDC048420]|uniref:hypothetical protein n=1 Tax=Streptomyces sp. NPDC048420 TaxID=3155755 RepID=UPI003446C5FC